MQSTDVAEGTSKNTTSDTTTEVKTDIIVCDGGPKMRFKSNQVIVNTKSSFKCHLARCQSIIDDTNHSELVLKGVGRAIPRAVNLAIQLNANNCNTFEVEPNTFTANMLDDVSGRPIVGATKDTYLPDDATDKPIKKISRVPGISIRVRKSKLELEKVKKVKDLLKN